MKKITLILNFAGLLAFSANAFAGGCAPGEPCWEPVRPRERVVQPPVREVVPPPPPVRMEKKAPVAPMEEKTSSGIQFGISPGINVLHMDCEEAQIAPAIYFDVRQKNSPLNLRVGVEGAAFDAEQYKFNNPQTEFGTSEPDVDLIRVPVMLEYGVPVGEDLTAFVGAGPALEIIDGDRSDTTVSLQVGSRLEYSVNDDIGVSVNAGYIWGEGDYGNEDIDLDGAYTGANVTWKLGN